MARKPDCHPRYWEFDILEASSLRNANKRVWGTIGCGVRVIGLIRAEFPEGDTPPRGSLGKSK
jgi:hypothetical protein